MPLEVHRIEYFYATAHDEAGAGYQLLSILKKIGVNLLAFSAVPVGPIHVQLALFPDDPPKLQSEARKAGLALDGPHPALLVRGDDDLGALASIHEKLSDAGLNIYAANGITDGRGGFSYLVYLKLGDLETAMRVLKADPPNRPQRT